MTSLRMYEKIIDTKHIDDMDELITDLHYGSLEQDRLFEDLMSLAKARMVYLNNIQNMAERFSEANIDKYYILDRAGV